MFNLNKKKIEKFFSNILNSKITYFVIILIMLIQFFLVSIIFLQNNKNKYIIEQANYKTAFIENEMKKINEKINSLQANIMRLSSMLYRSRADDSESN